MILTAAVAIALALTMPSLTLLPGRVRSFFALAPIAFDASVPLPPPPTLTVTPGDGLADRQIVSVTGDGFGPKDPVVLIECVAGDPQNAFQCGYPSAREVQVADDATLSTTLQMRQTVDVYDQDG